MNGDSLGSLEVGARQLAKTAMQSAGYEDINQLKDAVRDGALKVSTSCLDAGIPLTMVYSLEISCSA